LQNNVHELSRASKSYTQDVQSLTAEQKIQSFYRTLYRAWGPQHWWPAQSRFEVIVGCYLTQNTSWSNVEKALASLRAARVLSLKGIRKTRQPKLETLIRSAGYFRQKAKSLKAFVAFVDAQYGGSLDRMFSQPTPKLRRELLDLSGVGPETADSILLYAGNHPVFVVDAYTRRILARHNILPENAKYDEIRALFETGLTSLANDPAALLSEATDPVPGTTHVPSRMSRRKRSQVVQIFNDMHGLIVGAGKNYCLKSRVFCESCPLHAFLPEGFPGPLSAKARL
jgi:endonuclease-3 related protein